MQDKTRPRWLLAVVLLIALHLSGASWLQAQRATVSGTVMDPSEAVIPHAKITLEHSGRTLRRLDSNAAGSFLIRDVPSGEYDLRVSAEGFLEQVQHLVIAGQPRVEIRIKLPVLVRADDVNVTAENPTQLSTEIEQNQSANTVDRDALDRLPVFDADYITTLSRFLNSDATGTAGVSLIVNGVEANGPGVSASGIQSVRINQNPYTAIYAAPGRARIEITTKPGTPQFHGSVNFLLRNSVFDAKNYFATVKPSEKRTYFEGALTGPLSARHKTTFLLTANHDDNRQQAVVVAATPSGGVQQNVPNPTVHDFYSGRVF
ncbi:MAG TPA: carboxypeptidase-like regulatory domain-containing protein, partial [Edaphobacter sp.]|nr:carboxypeptidase-like regulatory domain-containing protein [Edaphobacter sp.]